jgi:hypothetical protein
MAKVKFLEKLIAMGVLSVVCLATVPAEATVDHTYVSGKGSDTGGCVSPSIACRTFAYAISQTTASGEIIVLDAADYAPVTITKSISIVADSGGPAGIVLASGNAITIDAGSSDIVSLRGLTLEGDGAATSGIVLNSAGSLTIADCSVRSFQSGGIVLAPYPTLPIFSKVNISILNSVMDDNGTGLSVTGTGFLETVVAVRKSVANHNAIGFSVTGATVYFTDSMAIGNTGAGIAIGPINGDVSHSLLLTYGDNEIDGNGTNVSGGTLSSVAKQ